MSSRRSTRNHASLLPDSASSSPRKVGLSKTPVKVHDKNSKTTPPDGLETRSSKRLQNTPLKATTDSPAADRRVSRSVVKKTPTAQLTPETGTKSKKIGSVKNRTSQLVSPLKVVIRTHTSPKNVTNRRTSLRTTPVKNAMQLALTKAMPKLNGSTTHDFRNKEESTKRTTRRSKVVPVSSSSDSDDHHGNANSTPKRLLRKRNANITYTTVMLDSFSESDSFVSNAKVPKKSAGNKQKLPTAEIAESTSSQHKKPSAKGKESCNIPECPLPCRNEQFEKIWKFVYDNIRSKTSGALYIHGVPGAGKTAIVESVLNSLNTQMKNEKEDKFKCVFINGLKLSNPDKIWRTIYRDLTGNSISSSTAHRKLLAYFESTKRIPVVLVVDELDQLLDNRQEILYRLLEWSSSAFNMFSLLAIFNTMSIPENVLTKRNDSRKGFSRALFEPYSHEQLELIVSNSLKHQVDNDTQLTQEAVRLICKKVAALSGDARRALEIARRALELLRNNESTSGVIAVRAIFKEIFQSAKVDGVKYCSKLEKQCLKVISAEVKKSAEDAAFLSDVLESVTYESGFEGVSWTMDSFLCAVSRLEQMGLIALEKNGSSLHRRVMLNMPSEDIMYGIGDD